MSTRVGADGRLRPLSSQEGRRRAAQVMAERPTASLREVAAAAGISVGTAHDVRQRLRRGESPVHLVDQRMKRRAEQESAPHRDSAAPLNPPERAEPEGGADMDAQMILQSLTRDPALKQTDAGRDLLRWLHTHFMNRGEWDPFVSAVPPYRLESLATLARQCGNVWHQFAHELERRGRMTE